jgi:hypothetical protein
MPLPLDARQMPLILRSRATSAGSRFFSCGMLTAGFVAIAEVVFGAMEKLAL